MPSLTAFIDANVLYSMTVTNLILETARHGLFQGHWSDHIHDEWTTNLLADRPHITPDMAARHRQKMDAAVRDALVTGFEGLIPSLSLPDPDARCDTIVTFNLKDFPQATLAPYRLTATHPDTFLLGAFQHGRTGLPRLRQGLPHPSAQASLHRRGIPGLGLHRNLGIGQISPSPICIPTRLRTFLE